MPQPLNDYFEDENSDVEYSGSDSNDTIVEKPCDSAPCQNDASCSEVTQNNSYTCHCLDAYTGVHCEFTTTSTEVNSTVCISEKCLHGGTCHGDEYDFKCICKVGYTGIFCGARLPCSRSPCKNDGVCENNSIYNNAGSYTCECATGYSGKNCWRTNTG